MGIPVVGACLGVEKERSICVQLRSGLASLVVFGCRKIKIEVHSGT